MNPAWSEIVLYDCFNAKIMKEGLEATGLKVYGGVNAPCTEDKNNKNIKDNREGKSGKSEKRFSPPSIEEVDSYIREKGYTVDAERFVNFYESKGWYVGKNKMKNWRAAVATWQKEDNKRNGINQQRSCDKRRGTEATATRPEDYEGKF